MTNEVQNNNVTNKGKFENVFRVLVLILLVILILVGGITGYFTYKENKENAAKAELCYKAITNTDLSGLLSEYQKAVYENPSVDNIYQQTFMANEYQIMVIAAQTNILSACLP